MNARSISAVAFSLFFIFAGSIHFVKTQFYVDKLPAFVPAKRALVFAAGVVEIILALLALMPATRRPASLAIMAFLCCIIPINIVHLIRAQGRGPAPADPLAARGLSLLPRDLGLVQFPEVIRAGGDTPITSLPRVRPPSL